MIRRFDPTEARQAPTAVAAWVLGPDGVRWHLRALAAAAVLLVLVNIALDPVRLWSLPAIGVWGIVLAVHAGLAGAASAWVAGAAPVAAKAAMGAKTLVASRAPAALGGAAAVAPPHPSRRSPDAAPPPERPVDPGTPSRPDAGGRFRFAKRGMPEPDVAATDAVERGAVARPAGSAESGVPLGDTPRPAEPLHAAAPRPANGAVPDAVAALWGPAVPAASPTMVEHYAGWRWGPASGAAPPSPASFAPPQAVAHVPPAPPDLLGRRAPSARSDEAVPLELLANDAAPESSLTGD